MRESWALSTSPVFSVRSDQFTGTRRELNQKECANLHTAHLSPAGCRAAPPAPTSPKVPESHLELTRLWRHEVKVLVAHGLGPP